MRPVLEQLVLRRTFRLPAPGGRPGDGAVLARQLDSALLSAGFTLSGELLERLSTLAPEVVEPVARRTLDTVRELVGDHVRHNVYFKSFPAGVPDTVEFWHRCLTEALADDRARPGVLAGLRDGLLNLLSLPSYGSYRHTYEEMLAAHDELVAAAGDRITVLHLGGPLEDELSALYLSLASSPVPLGEDGLDDLKLLAGRCSRGPQPEAIPVRENRAVINAVRAAAGQELLLDTVTDVLRLACALSGGAVTLEEPVRFRSLRRPLRRALLAGLDRVVADSPAKLADVHRHRERWKRLGERLHPHEHPRWPHAAQVFAVARGEREAPTFDSRVEKLLADGDTAGAADLLASAPGRLYRALDRLVLAAGGEAERTAVTDAAARVAPEVSGRVLLSVRAHLENRAGRFGEQRVFLNRSGRAWATADTRPGLPRPIRERLVALADAELRGRLPRTGTVVVDPAVLDVALPLSGRNVSSGLGVLPRGSSSAVEGELLRFFTYWRQKEYRTDHDLSALLLDEDYRTLAWLDWTALTAVGGAHSGDVTDAPEGASEFIDLRLDAVEAKFVVPMVHVYSGENFEQVAESFFGFMLRDAGQAGAPFEPRTVRMKSELRGPGRVALPLVFVRDEHGGWYAKWMHVHLKGTPEGNQAAQHRVSAGMLVRATVERRPLTVRYLTGLLAANGVTVIPWDGETAPDGPVTFVGLVRPEGLHPGARVFTPENLRDLIPA
jgi:stress response protein SCP2